MDISFLREHILEIRTMISQNPPQLIFMPVKVYDWVNWGPYTIIGHQEGVYSVRQLLDIISYYEIYNPKMLERYGELRDLEDIKIWVFKIFQNLTVPLEEIKGKMQHTSSQEYGVAFELNNHRVTVVDNDGKTLYTITSNSEFTALITEGAEPATNH